MADSEENLLTSGVDLVFTIRHPPSAIRYPLRLRYLASPNSVDGTHPSLPSSSDTFQKSSCFSPDGYNIIPGSRSRTTFDLMLGSAYILPGFAIVTDCDTL